MRKQLFIISILALLITSCAPRSIIRVNPTTDQGVWLYGQQFLFDTTTDINVYIAFDREYGDCHAFSVEYVNRGESSYLVDPAQIKVQTQPFDTKRFQPESFTAIDPELRLLAMDKAISRSQAQAANASIIAAVVLGAGMVAIASDAHHNRSIEKADLHANMAITGAEVAAISSDVATTQSYDLAYNKQTWEGQTIRKTTLAPNMSIQGLVFIPKKMNALDYIITIPVRGKEVQFTFRQNIIKATTPNNPAAGMP